MTRYFLQYLYMMNASTLNYNNYAESQPILSKEAASTNGRINLKEAPCEEWFAMQEKIAVKNTASEYREALTGNLESNPLSEVFFSSGNIRIIQNGIRAGVYKLSNSTIVVPPQNVDNLKIIMRSVYMQYAEHKPKDITAQVERLNKVVLNYAVKDVYSAAISYQKYIEDQSSLATPLEHPAQVDRDFKQMEFRSFL